MDWNDTRLLDSICYDLVLGEYPRSLNRAMIDDIANGNPPYSDMEVEENNIAVNVNDLTHTRKMHDGRTQFSNAFMKTGNHVTCRTDEGPRHKRSEWNAIVTKEFNRPLKRSIRYFERQRAKFGMLVLHGISSGIWENADDWCAKPIGVEDVLIPSNTLLGFDNLPFFVLRRKFTAIELQTLTAKQKRDPGWNMGMVERIMKWIDTQTMQLRNTNWGDVWKPEATAERIKEDTGYYMGDQVPAIDCFDIYAYDESEKESGWIRRIMLDSWSTPHLAGIGANGSKTYSMSRNTKLGDLAAFKADDFLFTSGKRKVADSWQNILAFQFADLSAVFPARYHSVRSLGWLMYAPCHLGNRMRCSFYESVFEALMQLFRVKSGDEAQKALQVNLVNRGFIDDSINPVPAQERWQVNHQLVGLGLSDNQQIIAENSQMFSQNQDYSRDRTEKTKFQVMAELNAVTSLVSAALAQAYQYEVFEDREMFRRFCQPNSKNPEVRMFRAGCLRQGVREDALIPDKWDVEHERVMGGGNKTMEMTIAQWLMENRPAFDPEPQRKILRDAVIALTDDASRADLLVPEPEAKVTPAVHEAQKSVASLMMNVELHPLTGQNHIEVVGTLLGEMAKIIEQNLQAGGIASPTTILGLQNMARYISEHIEILAMDESQKPLVKEFSEDLSRLMNEVRAFAQRLEEAMKQQAQGGNGQRGLDPKDAAKIEGMRLQAQTKMANTRESHAQRTAQRQIQFEQKMRQDMEQHRLEMEKQAAQMKIEASKGLHASRLKAAQTDIETAANVRSKRLNSMDDGSEMP